MRLPYYQHESDGIQKMQQTGFGGINHNVSARNGELYDCENFVSDNLPVLSTREKRKLVYSLTPEEIGEGYEYKGVFEFDGSIGYIKGHRLAAGGYEYTIWWKYGYCTLVDVEAEMMQTVVKVNKKLAIFPLGVIVDPITMDWERISKTYKIGQKTYKRYKMYSYPAVFEQGEERDTLWYAMDGTASTEWNAEDLVTISGCGVNYEEADLTPNNKTATIREAEVKFNEEAQSYCTYLYFDPNTFVAGSAVADGYIVMPVLISQIKMAAFDDGEIYGQSAEKNTLWFEAESTVLEAGDTVQISGCGVNYKGIDLTPNNKTATIREVEVKLNEDIGRTCAYLRFDENTFVNGEAILNSGAMEIVIGDEQPAMDYFLECNNRLWGCKGDTIYASKLGDPTEWDAFDGLESDSWTVETGTTGEFLGCINYNGYPIFFKKDKIFKIYGSTPSTFQLVDLHAFGLGQGASESLAVAGGALIYYSDVGFMLYDGSMPRRIQAPLGRPTYSVVKACSDGIKYYCQAGGRLLVYDAEKGTWLTENTINARSLTGTGDACCAIADREVMEDEEKTIIPEADIWEFGPTWKSLERETPAETRVEWSAEFADFDDNDPDKKGISKFLLRIGLGTGASATVYISYDSGPWETNNLMTITAAKKRSYTLPIIPRRADHYRIKIEGSGPCDIYTLTREEYSGSELRSTEGRQ